MAKFKVGGSGAGQRADVFVTAQYPRFTRSSLETLFDRNLVIKDGRPVKPSEKLSENDVLNVDDGLLSADPPTIELPVIYEDGQVLVIDKPAGVLTHSKGVLYNEPTVASYIAPKLRGFPERTNRTGIVHRLDRPTSGVIITARTPESLRWLQKQFSARRTTKTYRAVVEGVPAPSEAIIDAPIARSLRKPQTFTVSAAGRPAQTRYKVIKSFEEKGNAYSLLELQPATGRTHQLRVHLAYIGHPIVGDPVYGNGSGPMLLHAESLEISLPGGVRRVFRAEVPAAFKDFVKNA